VIILDANVLAALMRASPDIAVIEWLDRQPAESVWITSITLFETLFDLALLPSGRRRQVLESAFVIWKTASWISIAQQQPRLPRWQRRGRQAGDRWTYVIPKPPGLLSRGAQRLQLATRHFTDLKISIVDPWAPI
jgi:predicted nucleic acid-binding protein